MVGTGIRDLGHCWIGQRVHLRETSKTTGSCKRCQPQDDPSRSTEATDLTNLIQEELAKFRVRGNFFAAAGEFPWQSGPLRDSVGFRRTSTERAAPWRQCGHCTSPGITFKPTCSRGPGKNPDRLAGGIGTSRRFPGSRATGAFFPFRRPARPAEDRAALARAFAAKAVFNLPTTRAPSGRLQVDRTLRRLCGWSGPGEIPSEATFSRAFAEFSECALPARLHEAVVRRTLGDRVVGHETRRRRPASPEHSPPDLRRNQAWAVAEFEPKSGEDGVRPRTRPCGVPRTRWGSRAVRAPSAARRTPPGYCQDSAASWHCGSSRTASVRCP